LKPTGNGAKLRRTPENERTVAVLLGAKLRGANERGANERGAGAKPRGAEAKPRGAGANPRAGPAKLLVGALWNPELTCPPPKLRPPPMPPRWA